MSSDDPFAEPGDLEPTVVGGRRVAGGDRQQAPEPPQQQRRQRAPEPSYDAPPAGGYPPAASGAIDTSTPLVRTGINPLVSVASPLLGLAVRIRNRAQHRDVAALRERVVAEIKAFESRASAVGVSPQEIRAGRYALCATIDDLVLNTPWGSRSVWARQSMVTTFYQETWGGERFYEILNRLGQNPGRNLPLLELMYLCMTLGFEGQYRVMNRGTARHAEIRDGLYRMIRRHRGEFERDLSPRWRGAETGHRPLASYIPIWVLAVATAGLLALIYALFMFWLGRSSDDVYYALNELPPNGPVVLARVATPPPPPAPTPEQVQEVASLSEFLAPEIEQGLVEVEDTRDGTLVRLVSAAMFAPASDVLTEQYRPTVLRVAYALQERGSDLQILGHSDSDPIHTFQFPSNYELSLARAEAVREVIAPIVGDAVAITVEGLADTQPLVPNDTAANKARNRRVEILVLD
ncbi:MAG: DotU family type IV/VI secretion system protein [Rhodospirillaceae bacterium]|nr:DotU family type IV/VI secretion system protein [Rhodospirillaceae bacterium]